MAPLKHDFYERDDELQHCKVCGGAEASMPTDCPGTCMTSHQQDDVMAGRQDFVAAEGGWVNRAPAWP